MSKTNTEIYRNGHKGRIVSNPEGCWRGCPINGDTCIACHASYVGDDNCWHGSQRCWDAACLGWECAPDCPECRKEAA